MTLTLQKTIQAFHDPQSREALSEEDRGIVESMIQNLREQWEQANVAVASSSQLRGEVDARE